MRFTKQKRHRKIVKFYTACYGFREPFKVLCDGPFIHHLTSHNLSPQDSVSTALASSVQLFTSQCVIEELKSLGSSHASSLLAARRDYRFARCEHKEKVSALDCIVEIIGEKNPEHFFVATQDIELRKKCREIPGVPVIFGLRNALFLEQLSSFQRGFVKAAEEERLHVTDSEFKLLQKRVKKVLNTDEVMDPSSTEGGEDEVSEQQVFEKKRTPKRGVEMKDKAQFKRKRAKGPNPLSCKKKKNINNSAQISAKNDKGGSDAQRNRSRKRKRTRKTNSSSLTDGASN